MKTKDEIISRYTKDGLDAASDGALSMLTVLNMVEVLIDIRDILNDVRVALEAEKLTILNED